MDEPIQVKRSKMGTFRLWKRKATLLPVEPREDVLLAAQRVLANCSSVKELTIVLHDLLPPPSFKPFLKTMWASIASNLRHLTIDATLVKFPLILHAATSRAFPKLTDLDISIAISRFPFVREPAMLLRAILPLINTLKETLQSLAVSSSELVDVTSLFLGLDHFPHLRKLSIHIPMSRLTFVAPHSLTSFILRHKDTLQHFALGLPDVAVLQRVQDFSYETWLNQGFCELDLPVLQSLHIGVSMKHPFSDTVIPLLSPVKLPQLVSLTL